MENGAYKILAINPGSTSTKVALFLNDKKIFTNSVSHDAGELAKFPTISDQLLYRKKAIDDMLEEGGADLKGLDACVGRCGSLLPLKGGTYEASPLLIKHAKEARIGVQHPAILGVQIAKLYAEEFGTRVFTVNPPEVDELNDMARVTGVKGVIRGSHLHALNLKETAIRHAKTMGKKYQDLNLIVCHIGGGVSITAHEKGEMVDGNDIVFGMGPMSPTRCGSLPAADVIDLCYSGSLKSEVEKICRTSGGFIDLLGTSDAQEVQRRAATGDQDAFDAWEGMIYQICKWIGDMAVVLKGDVDGIVLGGGIVYSDELVSDIKERCSFIAPVTAYPGEFEMEALAQGTLRVLTDEEEAMNYDSQVPEDQR